jgi:integrase
LASPKFAKLAAGTQVNYRHLLELAGARGILGDVKVTVIRPRLVQLFLDGLADRPGAQTNAKVALKAVEKWAIVRDLLPYPITTGTEVVGGGDGHHPWSEQQVETAVRHACPDVARAIMLAASTGQRGSDLIRMRWSDVETADGRSISVDARMGINVRQRKTGLRLWIPLSNAIAAAMASWERAPGAILRNHGQPWRNRDQLTKAWKRQRDTKAELVPCRGLVMHGLRATACVRLSRLGATTRQIADMVGLSEPMVARYCRFSSQKENAMAAVLRLDGTPWQRPDQQVKMTP